MKAVDAKLLLEIANMEGTPKGAYNIRKDGELDSRQSTENVTIRSKKDKPGMDIIVKPGCPYEEIHIPVILTKSGMNDLVYNDFYIGEGSDVFIIAGCGIHNDGCDTSQHEGIHTFHIGKGAKVRYMEKHYGDGEGTGGRILNPQTVVYMEENAFLQMDTTQIRGVDSTNRYTKIVVGKGGEAIINEKLLTHGDQTAESRMDVILNGDDASSRIVSRSVAQDNSRQVFYPNMTGEAKSFGHVQCDSIIMGTAKIQSIPAITCNHPDAQLIHEAAIGRIAGEQLLKLQTLGLTPEEAEEKILNGFLN